MGFGFGAMTVDEIGSIRLLFGIFVVHQIFEGLGLASLVLRANIPYHYEITFAMIFSSTLPLGIAIGMNTQDVSVTGEISRGAANSFAAGILLYTGLVEMMVEDFKGLAKADGISKLSMTISCISGFATMALLALWG